MIAITGATGELGGRVADRLAKLGIKQRLMVRDPARAPDLPGSEVFQVSSYADAVAAGRALTGVETLLIIPAEDLMGVMARSAEQDEGIPYYNRVHQHIALVAAAGAVSR